MAPAGLAILLRLQSRQGHERAVAEVYQVTGRPGRPDRGMISVSGTLTRQGVECPTMRGDDGRTYSLSGNLRNFRPGDRVSVEGRISEFSSCQHGVAVEVRGFSRID